MPSQTKTTPAGKDNETVSASLKTVTLIHNVTTDADSEYANQVLHFFKEHNVTVHHVEVVSKELPQVPPEAEKVDMVFVLGGDGTVLRAAQHFVSREVPLVGINTGTLGFLTRIEADKLVDHLKAIMNGDYTQESRVMLSVDYQAGDKSVREAMALNDVVVKNTNPSQLCTLSLYINDTLVAVYDADGIVVSTSTGSTAYNLSAGGPVLSPEVEAISITPVCPHSFSSKAVVVPANKTIRIESHNKNQDVLFALDGQEYGMLKPGQSITIFKAPKYLRMVQFNGEDDNFYILLKKKLDWSMNPRWKAKGIE